MSGIKHIKVNGHTWRYQRNISKAEMDLFNTHIGREFYYFKIVKGGAIRFYVRNKSYN